LPDLKVKSNDKISVNSSRQPNTSLKTAPVSAQNISINQTRANFHKMVKPPYKPKRSSIEV
jgi:hypothetical protein